MKFALTVLISFILGTSFGSWFMFHAVVNSIERIDIETTAKRVVGDVEQAYENQLLKDDNLQRCLRQNARLKKLNGGIKE